MQTNGVLGRKYAAQMFSHVTCADLPSCGVAHRTAMEAAPILEGF